MPIIQVAFINYIYKYNIVANLSETLDEQIKDNDKSERSLELTKAKLDEAHYELSNEKYEVKELQGKLTLSEQRVASLTDDLAAAKQTISSLREDLAAANQRIDNLIQAVNNMAEKLNKSNNKSSN